MKFLMNQSVSSNPPFFLRLLSPFVCSCGPIKGSRIGFAKFFRRNTTPLRVWRFPRNPWGLKLCHSNLRFTFATGTIKHQARGEKAVRSRNGFAHSGYSRSPSSLAANVLLGRLRMFADDECYGLSDGVIS